MGYLEGLLGGFVGRKREVEQENIRQADLASERENRVLGALISSDDPEIRNMALSGLLESTQPRQKASGLKGWLGERQASPVFQRLQTLMQTPVTEMTQEPGPPTLGSTQTASGQPLPTATPQTALMEPQPAAGAPAAMPENQTVRPGAAPPPTPTTITNAPPTPTSITRLAMRPRQVFMSPTEKVGESAKAKEIGDIVGMRAGLRAAGFNDEDATTILRQHLARKYGSGMAYQHVPVEIPDGSGGYTQTMATYDRSTGQYLDDTLQPIYGARPLTHTGSTTLGADRETFAKIMYGKRASELPSDQIANVQGALDARKGALTTKDALSAAQRFLPNASIDKQLELADALKSGTAAPTVGPAGPPAPAAATTPAPAAAPGATPAALPTPGSAPAPPPKPGGLAATVPKDLSSLSKESGKPLPANVQQAVARTKSMNDVIDRAMAALEPYKGDTKLDTTVNLMAKYRGGTEDNPLALAAAQLPDLAGLQQSASTALGGASRSQRIYADRRQHTPRLPSGRQINFAKGETGFGLPAMGAERVQKFSLMRGDEGGFDSPAQIYLKLKNLKEVNDSFIKDMQEAAGGVAPMPSHAPAGGATPGKAYQTPDGQWHLPQ